MLMSVSGPGVAAQPLPVGVSSRPVDLFAAERDAANAASRHAGTLLSVHGAHASGPHDAVACADGVSV